jgi:hypothetical protein
LSGFAEIPVPVDLLIYTQKEWEDLERQGRRIVKEVEWLI